QRIAEKELGDVVLTDIVEGLPQGKALDLLESGPLCGYDSKITGTNDYRDIEGSDIVVITAGIARKPGMTRDDLQNTNAKIIKDASQKIAKYAPDAIVIVVTNPLDIMTYHALKVTDFEAGQVMGMSGVLDSCRLESFIAAEAGRSVQDVSAMVLGGHGDTMVPLLRYTTISGIPATDLFSHEKLSELVDRTINGGAEIVELLKTGSAFYAPSAAITLMVEAIVKDKRSILPASAYLDGEYGMSDVCLGVPVKLGSCGIEEIVELALTDEEKAKLEASAEAVREGIGKLPA
ncbi:MAG TPA: malate dehydrogenase, partial [Candidatus Methanoperedenaceae archaeon]|nr:malate dehydrogenase [Candidatus Methanoperedenaceae archaeon]